MAEAPKPNPAMFGSMKKGFEKIGEEAKKGGEALAKLGDAIPTNKQQGVKRPFKRREHLTQRPFLAPSLIGLRKQLSPNNTKK